MKKYVAKFTPKPRGFSILGESNREVCRLNCGWFKETARLDVESDKFNIQPVTFKWRQLSIHYQNKEVGRIRFNWKGNAYFYLQIGNLKGRKLIFHTRGMFSYGFQLEENGKRHLLIAPAYGARIWPYDYAIECKTPVRDELINDVPLLIGLCLYAINYSRQAKGFAWELV